MIEIVDRYVVLLIPFAMLVAGGVSVRRGLRERARISHLDQNGLGANATITDVRSRLVTPSGGNATTVYRPVVRFSLPDGRVVETETGTDMGYPPKVGEKVEVVYLVEDPTKVELDKGPGDMSTFAGMKPLATGACFVALGLYVLVSMLR